MNTIAGKLARFALNLRFDDLPEEVLHKAKQMLLDTLGCALGGYLSEPSRITRNWLRTLGGTAECTVIGSGERVPCANAALANGVMLRYLDFNDSYVNASHPSEIIATALAVAERQHADGKDLMTALVLGYQAHCQFADAFPFAGGWRFDNVTYGAFAAPIIAGRFFGLTEEQVIHAVGIAGCHNLTIGKAIKGGSMMKAMGYPFAAQSGIHAALLAKEGLTAAGNVIEMFSEINGGGEAELAKLAEDDGMFKIMQTGIKPYACEFMMHTWIEAVLRLTKEHGIRPDDIEAVHVKTFQKAVGLARPDAYRPATREKADHSGPYCLAIAILEGGVGPEQFAREQWKDPKVLDLMAKITCSEDPELTKLFPPARPVIVEMRTKKGEVHGCRVDYNLGHPKNPMTDEEVQAKFRRLASKVMAEGQIGQIIDKVYHIEAETDARDLMRLLTV